MYECVERCVGSYVWMCGKVCRKLCMNVWKGV